MHKTVEAIIDENGRIRLLEKVDIQGSRRALITILEEPARDEAPASEAALLSEAALAEDWNRAEEDEAWQHLQPGPAASKNKLYFFHWLCRG